MKRYFEYFTQKPGLWVVTIIILGLLGGMIFLDVLSARQITTMIGDVKDSIHGFFIRQSLMRGALTAAVIVILIFLIANERARFQILNGEVKSTTTGLERYTKRLKRSEEKYRSLVESADDIIYTMDKYSNILSINRCFSRLMGRPAAELDRREDHGCR